MHYIPSPRSQGNRSSSCSALTSALLEAVMPNAPYVSPREGLQNNATPFFSPHTVSNSGNQAPAFTQRTHLAADSHNWNSSSRSRPSDIMNSELREAPPQQHRAPSSWATPLGSFPGYEYMHSASIPAQPNFPSHPLVSNFGNQGPPGRAFFKSSFPPFQPSRASNTDIPAPEDVGCDHVRSIPTIFPPFQPAIPSITTIPKSEANFASDHSHSRTSTCPPPSLGVDKDKFPMGLNHAVGTFRRSGTQACVNELLRLGVENPWTMSRNCEIIKDVKVEIEQISAYWGKSLGNHIRLGAMCMFREHWEPDGACAKDDRQVEFHGMVIADFLGSLFSHRLVFAEDINLCLELLVDGQQPVHYTRLAALYTLLDSANDKLCKQKNITFMRYFHNKLESTLSLMSPTADRRYQDTRDIIDVIQDWFDTQAEKRERASKPQNL